MANKNVLKLITSSYLKKDNREKLDSNLSYPGQFINENKSTNMWQQFKNKQFTKNETLQLILGASDYQTYNTLELC